MYVNFCLLTMIFFMYECMYVFALVYLHLYVRSIVLVNTKSPLIDILLLLLFF